MVAPPLSGRSILIAALAFAALLALTLAVLRRTGDGPPEAFFSLARETPDTLTVVYGENRSVLVPGGFNGWTLIEPVRDEADVVVVNGLLNQLRELDVPRTFPLTADKLDAYGMRFPRGMVVAAYADAPPDSLIVGGFSMGGTQDYVRAGGSDRVGQVSSTIPRSYLLKTPDELRDPRALPFHERRALELTLFGAGGGTTVRVLRGDDGHWQVLEPFAGPGGGRRILDYLRSVSHMHVERFLRESVPDWGPYGLERPRASIRVIADDGRTLQLSLGDPVPDTDLLHARVRDRPQLMAVSNKYLPVLQRGHAAFRDPVVLPFGLADVDTVHVRWGPRSRTFAVGAESTDPPGFRDALGAWILAEPVDFEPGDTPFRTRGEIVWQRAGEPLAVLELGPASGGRIPARVVRGSRNRPGERFWYDVAAVGPLWDHLRTAAPSP